MTLRNPAYASAILTTLRFEAGEVVALGVDIETKSSRPGFVELIDVNYAAIRRPRHGTTRRLLPLRSVRWNLTVDF